MCVLHIHPQSIRLLLVVSCLESHCLAPLRHLFCQLDGLRDRRLGWPLELDKERILLRLFLNRLAAHLDNTHELVHVIEWFNVFRVLHITHEFRCPCPKCPSPLQSWSARQGIVTTVTSVSISGASHRRWNECQSGAELPSHELTHLR